METQLPCSHYMWAFWSKEKSEDAQPKRDIDRYVHNKHGYKAHYDS